MKITGYDPKLEVIPVVTGLEGSTVRELFYHRPVGCTVLAPDEWVLSEKEILERYIKKAAAVRPLGDGLN